MSLEPLAIPMTHLAGQAHGPIRFPWRGVIRHGVLFGLAFWLTAAAINQLARHALLVPEMGLYSRKLWLIKQEPAVDIVFLGTSRFNSAIHPEQFDARMAELGCPVRSFNMGIDDLNPVEARVVLRQIRQQWPDRPIRVVLGQMVSRYKWYRRVWDRVRYFNTWSHLPEFVEDIWLLPNFMSDRLMILLEFFGGFLYEQASPGYLAKFLFPGSAPTTPSNPVREIRGYFPDMPEIDLKERIDFEERIRQSVAEIDRWPEEKRLRNGVAHGARMRLLIEEARALGFSPGVLLTPSVLIYGMAAPTQSVLARDMPEIPVWNHADPKRHTEFFQAEHLQDWSHLNRKGATRLARILAEDICPVTRQGGF
ncbi:MAG: hypothetical protein HQL97_08480 [Magnetococcales bacterium]|nr:hypothetical protein [Magnetococcales bacterium]